MTTGKDLSFLRLVAQRLVGPGLPTATEVVRHLTCMQAQDLPGALASVMLRTTATADGATASAAATADGAAAPAGATTTASAGVGAEGGTITSAAAADGAAAAVIADAGGTGTGTGTAAAADGGIVDALAVGEVVRSWPMRGTLHLVPAEDLGWMLSLTSERLIAGAARRRQQLGIDEPMLHRAGEVVQEALRGGGSLSRTELMALWEQAGLMEAGQRGYHLLWHLSQRGLTCFGPLVGGEQRIVLLDEWVPRPRTLERDEALGEWALRYFRGHGPATRKDFMWWTKLTGKEVTAALAVARPQLEVIDVDGADHFLDPATPQLLEENRRAARGVLLLPGFDELILGYQDRSAMLPVEHADRIVPGGNGMFRPTVVAGGRVVGTWRRTGSGARRRIEAEPFTTFTQTVERELARRAGTFPAPV